MNDKANKPTKFVGVTGGMAVGKSTLCRALAPVEGQCYLVERAGHVPFTVIRLSVDSVVDELLRTDANFMALAVACFGPEIINVPHPEIIKQWAKNSLDYKSFFGKHVTIDKAKLLERYLKYSSLREVWDQTFLPYFIAHMAAAQIFLRQKSKTPDKIMVIECARPDFFLTLNKNKCWSRIVQVTRSTNQVSQAVKERGRHNRDQQVLLEGLQAAGQVYLERDKDASGKLHHFYNSGEESAKAEFVEMIAGVASSTSL